MFLLKHESKDVSSSRLPPLASSVTWSENQTSGNGQKCHTWSIPCYFSSSFPSALPLAHSALVSTGLLDGSQSYWPLSYPRAFAVTVPSCLATSLTSGRCYISPVYFLRTSWPHCLKWHLHCTPGITDLSFLLYFPLSHLKMIFSYLWQLLFVSSFKNVSFRRAGILPALFPVVPQCLAHGKYLTGWAIGSFHLLAWNQWLGTFFVNAFDVTSEIGRA